MAGSFGAPARTLPAVAPNGPTAWRNFWSFALAADPQPFRHRITALYGNSILTQQPRLSGTGQPGTAHHILSGIAVCARETRTDLFRRGPGHHRLRRAHGITHPVDRRRRTARRLFLPTARTGRTQYRRPGRGGSGREGLRVGQV